MESTVQKKKGKYFTICTADARYVKPLLQKIIEEKPAWKETLIREKCDFRWFVSNVEDQECKFYKI